MRTGIVAVFAVACLTACSNNPDAGKPIRFNPVPTGAAVAPASASAAPAAGSSRVRATGEVEYTTTQDFQCSYAIDDFFIRGRMGEYDGEPLFMSINVEFYKRPGTYTRRTQVLFRRISDDLKHYASWYHGEATMTVLPGRRGADLQPITLIPESGSAATKPVTLEGHFGCLNDPTPGPG
ncbi:MAG: hypothetical protein JJD92_16140 [Frankiaceae bacterium]|nr:hypothetical protein [Frankiaceae bacterium]